MSQQELLTRVVQVLDAAGIDYLITGSVASSLQGEPRATHDIDIVVSLLPAAAAPLLAAFPSPGYSLDAGAVQEAIRRRSMFNLLDLTSGDKVDFWLLTNEPYDVARFARKRVEDVLNLQLKVSAPEDTIS